MKIFVVLVFLSFSAAAGKLIINGEHVPLKTGSIIDIDTSSGDAIASSEVGNTQCVGDVDLPSLSIEAFPSTIPMGGSSSIIWDVQDAISCLASGAWSGNKTADNGSHFENVSDITETSLFTLTCSGVLGQVVESVQVNIDTGIDPVCDSLPPISIARQSEPNEFNDLTTLPFGDATGDSLIYALNRNNYSAIEFNAPVQPMSKRITFEDGRPAEGGPAAYTVVISKCPGNFNDSFGQFCKVSGSTPLLRWTTDPNDQATNKCRLEPGEKYFINIVQSVSEGTGYTVTDCNNAGSTCGVLFAEIF
ncbi:hypothetical protein [Marinicella sp. W31]|uniref:hypothetical protein n=1 Tax=Marinicella sp. W31 TaxID=3023713 RepID=UPI0037584508